MSSREYTKLTVNLLKEELKKRNLDQSGKKAELIARLESDDVTGGADKQILNASDATNNTEDLDKAPKDLKEVVKPDDGPGLNNSINNEDKPPNKNNTNADNSLNNNNNQMDEAANDSNNNTCNNSLQQQEGLTSTTNNNNEAQNNNTNVSQSVVDTTSATSGVVGVVCDASIADGESGATRNHHGDSSIGSSTTTNATFHDDVTGSNNTNNNPAISSDNSNQAISSDNNQTTSSTTNDSMDTSDSVVKDNNDSNNPTTSDNNNYNNPDNANEAKLENNEAKSDTNNEAEKSENISTIKAENTPIKVDNSTTDAPASDPTTTTSDTTTTPTKAEAVVVVDEKKRAVDEKKRAVDEKKRAEEDTKIVGLFGIEMKRDFDAFQIKWHGKKFSVPFLGEMVLDLSEEISQRSFKVDGLTKDEVKSPVVAAMLEGAPKYCIDFTTDLLGSSDTGSVKITFTSKEECVVKEAELKEFKEGVVVSTVRFEEQVNQQFLHKDLAFYRNSIVDRLLYVGNIALETKEEEFLQLHEVFSNAVRIIIPSLKDSSTARYVYFEYENSEAVLEAAEAHKDASFMDNQLLVIKALCVRKERYGLLTDTLREILLEKVRKLKRIQKNPWNRSKQELNEIDKAIIMNMEKLAADSKHRKGWGMQLGALDEVRIEKEDFGSSTPSSSRSGAGGSSRGVSRGTFNRTPYDNRRTSTSGQRYGNYYGNSSGGSSGYGGNRSGWATSSQSPGYYGATGYQGYTQQHQGYGNYSYTAQQATVQQQQAQSSNYYSSANKRKASDSYSNDWKRPRNF